MQGGNSFIRSGFEYATRQRKTYCSDYMVKYKFTCNSKEQMQAFKDFYYQTLSNGVSVFNADWLVEGAEEIKEFRFASTYSVVALFKDVWAITAEFQMITKVKELGIAKYLLLDLPLLGSLVPRKSANPSTDVTFTRSTTASYIDRNGVLQYAAIDAARFESEGLLVEGGSTNLQLNGSIDADWSNSRCSIDYLNTIGADGVSNSASTVTVTDDSGAIYAYRSSLNITPVIGSSYTYSVFINPKDFIGLIEVQLHSNIVGGSSTNCEIIYNTETKVIQSVGSLVTGYSMQLVSNGFIRFSITAISVVDVASSFFGLVYMTGVVNGDSIVLYGAQVEELPFASSYIPTTTTAVTRGGELCNVTHTGNNSDKNGDITLLVDFDMFSDMTQIVYNVTNVANNRLSYESGLLVARYGSNSLNNYTAVPVEDVKTGIRAGLRLDAEQLSWLYNGVVSTSPTTVGLDATGDATNISLGSANGSSSMYGHIKNFRIYDTALTPTEVALA